MSLHQKLLLRAAAAALVLTPIAFGCSANGGPLALDDDDAGAPSPVIDAGGDPDDRDGDARSDSGRPREGACGDKKLDPGEECDDGNNTSGDGCSATCTRESAGPGDLCAGAIELTLEQQSPGTLYRASVAGNTSEMFNHYSATCGGGSGPEAVYVLSFPEAGRATARLSAPFPAVLSARSGCEDEKAELACKDNTSAPSGLTEIEFPVFPNSTVYFFVDGYGGKSGDFLLDVEIQTAFCGNGYAEYPEECDDGNTLDGDGCSSTCTIEGDTSLWSECPGVGYRVATTGSFAGDTSTLKNGGGSALACGTSSGSNSGAGPNAVYAITPEITGALKLDLLADYPNALLHVRRECAGTTNTSQYDCVAATEKLTPLTMTVPVFAEQTIFAFVDSSATANSGLYTLNATLTPAACGNGILDGGEECDDGNTDDDDGCSATCTVEIDTASHTCPGKAIRLESDIPGLRKHTVRGSTVVTGTTPVSKWSTTTTCGSTSPDVVYELTSDIDGYLTAIVKGSFNAAISVRGACDPGSTAPLVCTREASGNGPKTLRAAIDKNKPYYLVIDAYSANTTGVFELDLGIEPSVCGNGLVEGGETCDDGATEDGDGCSSTCQLETEKARDLCATAPAIGLNAEGDGTYTAKIVSGTTNLTHTAGVNATHTLSPCSSNGPDAWFAITPPIGGVLKARITEAQFRSAIGIRNGCPGGGTSQLACNAAVSNGGQEVTVPVDAGKTYYVVADGQNVTGTVQRGRFTIDLDLVPSGCGDTFKVAPEECDDGNTADGDGCSSTCTLETLPALAGCPGHEVALTGVGASLRRGIATVKTMGLPNNTGGQCGGSGPEGILRVVSDISGVLEVRATADFNVLVHGRNQCADPTTEIPRSSCSNNLGVLTTAVQKNVPIYLFVDGINGASGVAELDFTVTP